MPGGKRAGEKCIQLDDVMRCRIFGQPDRPQVCSSLQPRADMCGASREHALRWIGDLERATTP
jgi:hypothetical protein